MVYVYAFEENKLHKVFIYSPIILTAIEYQIIEYHFIFPFILFQIDVYVNEGIRYDSLNT